MTTTETQVQTQATCKCGCGQEVSGKDFFSGACRVRYHRKSKASELVTPAAQETAASVAHAAARQISEKAQGEIDALQSRMQELGQEREALYTERQRLLTDQAVRADHLVQLRSGVRTLVAAHQEAVSYASVAQGTLGEQSAIAKVNAAQKAIEPAQAYQIATEAEYTALSSAAATRLAAIDTQLASIATEVQTASQRITEVDGVRYRALQELGLHEYEICQAEIASHQGLLDGLKQALVEAQVERLQKIDAAMQTLQPWPELQRKITRLDEFDDPTARVLRSCLAYVERLIEDGGQVERTMRVPAAGFFPYSWLGILEVSRDVLFVEETLGGPKRQLHRQAQLLQQMLSQYIATKR